MLGLKCAGLKNIQVLGIACNLPSKKIRIFLQSVLLKGL